MLFSQALQYLKDGMPMRRASWDIDEGYLSFMPGMKHVWKIMLVPNPNAGNFIFSVEDFDGDDWEEFKAPEITVEAVVIEAEAEKA